MLKNVALFLYLSLFYTHTHTYTQCWRTSTSLFLTSFSLTHSLILLRRWFLKFDFFFGA
ncbi:hypothetical protein OAV88_01880 [bacterium]|nr:hypothetical protein [bacterium]